MRFIRLTILILVLFSPDIFAQASGVTWTEMTDTTLPRGIWLYRGERASPILKAWYLKVNLNDTAIAVRPYISSTPQGIVPYVQGVRAFAGINGGFFDVNTGASFSAVVYPGEVKAQNVASLNRSGTTYYATRSLFGITTQRDMGVRWIYHFGAGVRDIFTFAQPTPNSPGNPAPRPDSSSGTHYNSLLAGIGGGPTLVKNSQVNITYDQEVFFGSGVGNTNQDPRTAVGYTPDRQAILLVADGRSAQSSGVSLPELAQIMIELGCVEAMNLDGGGSTQMAVGSTLINRPEGGTSMRPVPTILAVVRAESLRVPAQATFERIIDTGDPPCTLIGTGWFPSANPGYWGNTPSVLHVTGPADAFAVFHVGLPRTAQYEVYGWWVASSNRCTDTPFIIKHASGRDTVRVNQTINGSQWKLIGAYTFSGDTSETVIISDAATNGSYVVADAIRIISYDPAFLTVREIPGRLPTGFALMQNYPNPFNPSTRIEFHLPPVSALSEEGAVSDDGFVRLRVYDVLGREVATLVSERLRPGAYATQWNAEGMASGIYFYRLQAGGLSLTRKLLLLQ